MLAALLCNMPNPNPVVRDTHDGGRKKKKDKVRAFLEEFDHLKKLDHSRRGQIEKSLNNIYKEVVKAKRLKKVVPIKSEPLPIKPDGDKIDWDKYIDELEPIRQLLKIYKQQLDEEDIHILLMMLP